MTEKHYLHEAIARELPTLEAVANLFHPVVEGVMHDLESGKIVALYNNLSNRQVGDPSAITKFVGEHTDEFPDIFEPYYKTNWDGAKFKCTSITIRNESGKPVGLMCINFNTSVFRGMNMEIDKLLAITNQNAQNPVEQFTEDWQDKVTQCITNYLQENNLTSLTLTNAQKRNLVSRLYAHGLFHYRNAAPHVAGQLGISRATIYKYLKEEKE
ncbi:MAG TPA: PAS domain-containing protein [Candidatus Saccharimonadales bacterium]|nr:PAS domain-containing protein [Candidatus Saccharimonadales bacterium]